MLTSAEHRYRFQPLLAPRVQLTAHTSLRAINAKTKTAAAEKLVKFLMSKEGQEVDVPEPGQYSCLPVHDG